MRRWLTWNVLFRLHEAAKGHPTFRILKAMEAADRLSLPALEQLRRAKLREFIDDCYRNVPYVKRVMQERGLEPRHIREPEDLRLLPVMTKGDVRRHRDALRSQTATRLGTCATGGSTGIPLIFDLCKRRVASRVACRQRVARWWGVSVGDPEIALWGAPIELGQQDGWRAFRDKLLGSRLLSAFEMDEAAMSRYLDILEQKACRHIFAYPSTMYALCLHARKQGRDLRRLGIRVVFVTSEVLYPYQRELIADVLNCPVADGYGGRDSGFISHECPQGGMHLMADAVIVETVGPDGQPVPAGQPGEIVVTDLYSNNAPFLRYATGDIGVLSARRCACGRALPILEHIHGRANDSIVASDGRVINSQALVYLLRDIEGIEQFRIHQKTVDCLHIQIVKNQDFTPGGESRLREAWTKLLRTELRVTFEYLPQLPCEPSGKFRHIVSDLPAAWHGQQVQEDPVPGLPSLV